MFYERTILAPVIAVALSLSFTVVSHATTIAQATDFQSISPNGAYQSVADHPDWNTDPDPWPCLIAYTLIDTWTGEVKWVRRGRYAQLISETWPGNAYGAYVGNHGNVLLYGPSKSVFTPLAALDGATGARTSGGISRRQRFIFRAELEIEDDSFLLFRSQRGVRRLLRFAPIEVITDLTTQQRSACESVERAYALSTLKDATKRLDAAIHRKLFPDEIPELLQAPEPPPTLNHVVLRNQIRESDRRDFELSGDDSVPSTTRTMATNNHGQHEH